MRKNKMNPSKKLLDMVNDWADAYITSVDLPVKILELATKEGLNKQEIRKIIDTALLSRGLTQRRIRQIMPDELKFSHKITDKSLKNKDAEISAAYIKEEEFEIPPNLPVTTPDTIIMKSEGEIAAEQYLKDLSETQELTIKRAEVQQLINNKILTEEQVYKWVNDKYLETFQIPKDINITQGAYHARLSPTQAVTQLKQLQNSVKTLEIGWKIIA